MPRLFIPETISTREVTIREEKARYLTTVLRCTAGDVITLTDSSGATYRATILNAAKKGITVEIIRRLECTTESPLQITLFQGLLKGLKMDLVIQKATELGVTEIRPVVTGRSQVHETKKTVRWRKIAEEASRQSGRTAIPAITEPVRFKDLFLNPEEIPEHGIIFWEEGGEALPDLASRFSKTDRIALFTGPEGGFTKTETSTASAHGFKVATLGKRILRAETAAIAAVSIIQYELGDMGNKAN